jgi:hypothetical protein
VAPSVLKEYQWSIKLNANTIRKLRGKKSPYTRKGNTDIETMSELGKFMDRNTKGKVLLKYSLMEGIVDIKTNSMETTSEGKLNRIASRQGLRKC